MLHERYRNRKTNYSNADICGALQTVSGEVEYYRIRRSICYNEGYSGMFCDRNDIVRTRSTEPAVKTGSNENRDDICRFGISQEKRSKGRRLTKQKIKQRVPELYEMSEDTAAVRSL